MGGRSERHTKNNQGTEGAGGTASSGRGEVIPCGEASRKESPI